MNNIREKLIRVSQLVDGGELERDLALSLLREIYSELKFGHAAFFVVPEPEPVPEPYIESDHTVFEVEPLEESSEPEPLASEPEPEFDPAPVMPAPAPEPVEAFVPRPAIKPEVIRSLYGDGSPRETLNDAARHEPETTPAILGESLRPDTRDVASAAAAAAIPVGASLRKSIGLNDRFVMIRDMFRGDTAAFDRTIDQLDRFSTLDDAVIWLHDNFALDPDSEGVGLLMNLLERRFS